MRDYHGIIFAYSAAPELRALVSARTAASLPFCGRYRLIDFALSSMRNAGINDVGVIMQRDYQSLLDHVGGGKAWDMSRRVGGLRMLPPFGLPEYHTGNYTGTIEALNAVSTYIQDIPQKHVVLMVGNTCANIDLDAAIRAHQASDAEITIICADHTPAGSHHRVILGEDGLVKSLMHDCEGESEGLASLEAFIIHKDVLLGLMAKCDALNLLAFHKNALKLFLSENGRMSVYVHPGYANVVRTIDSYYMVSMDMLCSEKRREVFPVERPVRTKNHEEVSSYYGESGVSRRSLIADNCIIDGEVENSIIFSGARIAAGAKIKNSIVMRGCTIEAGVNLDCVISDKYSRFSPGTELKGSPKLPIVVPKNSDI